MVEGVSGCTVTSVCGGGGVRLYCHECVWWRGGQVVLS